MKTQNGIETDAWIEDFLSGLLERTGLDLWVSGLEIEEEPTTHIVQLDGPDKARAIGRDGQVLEALQHLAVSAAANTGIFGDRIVVDIDGYRQRRDEKLRDDAERLAGEALQTQSPRDLEPMPARERRLVHMVVSKIDGVQTQSLGEGDGRFVRLVPA